MFGQHAGGVVAAVAGIQSVTGTVLPVARPGASNTVARHGQSPTPDQLVLLVQSAEGYENLMDLLSKAYLETDAGELPHVRWADFEGRTAGLIALSGGDRKSHVRTPVTNAHLVCRLQLEK